MSRVVTVPELLAGTVAIVTRDEQRGKRCLGGAACAAGDGTASPRRYRDRAASGTRLPFVSSRPLQFGY